MSVTILPVPASAFVPVHKLTPGDWIADRPEGPWHRVWEIDATSVMLGDSRATATVVEVTDPRLPVYRLDAEARPR